MTPAAEKLREAIRAIYAPIDRRSVVEWCEDELILSERQTQMPGQFSTRMTPYLREPLECFGDVDITDIVLVFGTQTGKTTMVQAGACWRIANKPQPCVWVMPTENLAGSFSETRWMPICEDSPAMAALIPKDRHRWKRLEQHFLRCSFVFVGSNSPANLASRPAGLLLLDEVEKFAQETDRETSALFLAENRTKSFSGALRVKTSTPTTPDGPIWKEYMKGTQEKFMLACPHCRERIELLWDQVKWAGKESDGWNMSEVEKTAHYKCQACGESINDGQKIEMLETGVWQATNDRSLKGFRSFHLNSLYAPWTSCTFGALAIKFLRDMETLNGLQDFRNSAMAMPWEHSETTVGHDSIQKLRGDYMRGSCPMEPDYVLIAADVGQRETHWVTTAFSESGDAAVLDYGTVLMVEDLLDDPILREYKTPSGLTVTIMGGLIDSGYSAFRVYEACQRSDGIFHPSKGSPTTSGSKIGKSKIPDFPGIVLYTYSDFAIKNELYEERILNSKPPIQIPKDCDQMFIRGLSGQMKIRRKTASGHEFAWKSVAQDHFGDCVKLCCIGYRLLKNL